MKEGQRINVKTRDIEGMATILYIAPGEFYPLQIELDGADADGHKIHRIAYREIVKEQEPGPGVVFAGPDDPQRYVGEVIQAYKPYNIEVGQRYILGVVTYPGVWKPGAATSFYLFDPETMRHCGCMPASTFKVLKPYTGEPITPKALKTAENAPKPEPIAMESEQLTLF